MWHGVEEDCDHGYIEGSPMCKDPSYVANHGHHLFHYCGSLFCLFKQYSRQQGMI